MHITEVINFVKRRTELTSAEKERVDNMAKCFRTLVMNAFEEGYMNMYTRYMNNLKEVEKQYPDVSAALEPLFEGVTAENAEETANNYAFKNTEGYEDGFTTAYEIGYGTGIDYGMKKGRLELLCELVNDKTLTLESAAEKAGFPIEQFAIICTASVNNEIKRKDVDEQ